MRIGIRELIFIVVMLGILGGSYVYVFKPASEKRTQLVGDTTRYNKELRDLKSQREGTSDLEKKIHELEQAIKFFEEKLPQQKELDLILKDVWQKAEKNGLTIKTVKTLKQEKAAGFTEQPFEMSMSGDFKPAFYSFLLELEQLPRIIKIRHMKLDKMMERDGAMQAQMTLCIYFESGDRN